MPQDYPGRRGWGRTEEQKLDLEASLLTPALPTPHIQPSGAMQVGKGPTDAGTPAFLLREPGGSLVGALPAQPP